jgi:predicted transcriptional regulator
MSNGEVLEYLRKYGWGTIKGFSEEYAIRESTATSTFRKLLAARIIRIAGPLVRKWREPFIYEIRDARFL